VSAEDKTALAVAAVNLLTPRETIFLDSSTTTYYVAKRLVDIGLSATVLTNSLPVMELLFREGGPGLEVIGIGGTLRRLTRSFVGPFAVRTVQGHFADKLFLSVKGIAANGMLTDADPLEAELKRTMIEQAGEAVLLIDHTKLSVRGLSVIAPIAQVATTIATGLDEAQADTLRLGGTTVRSA
jgi:DeoR/GlpR family transcriptional regulator of sugar metabolism